MKQVLSGNEAIARGAWEAGATFAVAYPGTPSTEILENVAKYYGDDVYAQWSPNEKAALEVGVGASVAGARTLVTMKHVGVNVAADPLFTAAYTGVGGGLVIVTADDPNLHSSQNEQDNRNYAKAAKIPMLEPTNSQEAKDFVRVAFELSEKYDTPVFLRTTTRISHSKSVVDLGERTEMEKVTQFERDSRKYTMLPAFARPKHPIIEDKLKKIAAEYSVSNGINTIEMGDTKLGIVSSGISYQYAKEAMPGASFLKVGMPYPTPVELAREFAGKVDELIVVEELDPFLEEAFIVAGIKVSHGKDYFPICGELSPVLISSKLGGDMNSGGAPKEGLPIRPPVLCPGCSHRGVFTILKKLKVFVTGDIGCYTLAALPPLEAMHTCLCMGGSITMAHGMSKVLPTPERNQDKVVAVIGDSTFFHSGVTGLIDMIYNDGNAVVVIQDNRITGMTGGQENPGSGHTLNGMEAPEIDCVKLSVALGVSPENVRVVSAYNLKEIEDVMKEELAKPSPSVVITKDPCVLQYKVKDEPYKVDREKCTGCKKCIGVGCIALSMVVEGEERFAEIDPNFCTGCSVCAQVCKFDAIVK
ncbi:MAG: indolepyruvate ferredoxin oxidoreductase subunit alpha [Deltaproteobacteria bacterium]|nr:MAG: indolepyruvate ferredoxin oxidoreductase subunit alpha [Deltaproteobacteria bacterium]